MAAVVTRLRESHSFQSIYTASPHAHLPQGPYFIHGKAIRQAWKLYEDDLDAFVVPTIVDDVTDPTRYAAARPCFCPRALTPCPTQFLRTPSRFAARHFQEHRRAKSTVLDPEQREAVGWGSGQHQGQLRLEGNPNHHDEQSLQRAIPAACVLCRPN